MPEWNGMLSQEFHGFLDCFLEVLGAFQEL
jgi:hypothetical protein